MFSLFFLRRFSVLYFLYVFFQPKMVAREEVAGLVLEWLRRENLLDTAATLSREAATLLDRLTKPEVCLSISTPSISLRLYFYIS
jgi:hypothetical protein